MTDNPTDKRRGGRIADYVPLIQATDGLTLSQVCAISSLEPSTIQNWIKRGFVPHPVGKKYRERHLARILLIAQLRETMPIERVGELLRYINGDTDDESDDIITEEALYDLFLDIADTLEAAYPNPDQIGETVDDILSGSGIEAGHRKKIAFALQVMAFAHLSNIYKQKANTLFNERKR